MESNSDLLTFLHTALGKVCSLAPSNLSSHFSELEAAINNCCTEAEPMTFNILLDSEIVCLLVQLLGIYNDDYESARNLSFVTFFLRTIADKELPKFVTHGDSAIKANAFTVAALNDAVTRAGALVIRCGMMINIKKEAARHNADSSDTDASTFQHAMIGTLLLVTAASVSPLITDAVRHSALSDVLACMRMEQSVAAFDNELLSMMLRDTFFNAVAALCFHGLPPPYAAIASYVPLLHAELSRACVEDESHHRIRESLCAALQALFRSCSSHDGGDAAHVDAIVQFTLSEEFDTVLRDIPTYTDRWDEQKPFPPLSLLQRCVAALDEDCDDATVERIFTPLRLSLVRAILDADIQELPRTLVVPLVDVFTRLARRFPAFAQQQLSLSDNLALISIGIENSYSRLHLAERSALLQNAARLFESMLPEFAAADDGDAGDAGNNRALRNVARHLLHSGVVQCLTYLLHAASLWSGQSNSIDVVPVQTQN